IMLEIGAFATAALLAGRLSSVALAAHQIAINCAAVTFMIPLGTASAAAVAVGQAIGRREPDVARRRGFIAIGLACVFMLCSALPLDTCSAFTTDMAYTASGADYRYRLPSLQ